MVFLEYPVNLNILRKPDVHFLEGLIVHLALTDTFTSENRTLFYKRARIGRLKELDNNTTTVFGFDFEMHRILVSQTPKGVSLSICSQVHPS